MWRQSTQMEKRSKGGGVRVCRKKKKKGILVQKDRKDFDERERKKERKREGKCRETNKCTFRPAENC